MSPKIYGDLFHGPLEDRSHRALGRIRAAQRQKKRMARSLKGEKAKRLKLSEPGIPMEPEDAEMVLTIRCHCGHEGVVMAYPALLIGRRLRCSSCGDDPRPF